MDFKRFLNERIAARGEERRKAKLEEARQAQIRLLSKQKEEEIEWQVQTENKRPAPLLLNGLVAKKRKRQKPENILVDHICVRNAAAEPQRSPKKPKHSSNLGASAKQDTESELARYAPASKPPRNKKNAGWREREIIDTRKKPSEWCLSTNVQNQKFNRGDRLTIPYFERLIAKCVNVIKNEGDTEQHFSELRKKLHEMEFYPFLSGVLVKKSKVLKSDGLLQIFDGHNKHVFPWDLAADAEALWMRLMSGDLDCHLMRGIEISKGVLASGKKRTSYKLEKSYTQKKSANAVGVNNLTNGQWWPYRICALRDGAHGEQEAGIYGQTGKGAYSVVVAVGGYADKDHGETIEYCGTASETSTPTKSTSLMLDSWTKNQPVRVLRAVNKQSKYAPKEGIRYDGLYQISDREILDPKTAMFRFSLKRIKGQDPIRYKGAEIRPTDQELRERMRIRKLLE